MAFTARDCFSNQRHRFCTILEVPATNILSWVKTNWEKKSMLVSHNFVSESFAIGEFTSIANTYRFCTRNRKLCDKHFDSKNWMNEDACISPPQMNILRQAKFPSLEKVSGPRFKQEHLRQIFEWFSKNDYNVSPSELALSQHSLRQHFGLPGRFTQQHRWCIHWSTRKVPQQFRWPMKSMVLWIIFQLKKM